MLNTLLLSINGTDDLIGIIVILVISAIFFFFLRGVLLWYWKVDAIVKNQEETNRLLKSISRYLESKDDHLHNQDQSE